MNHLVIALVPKTCNASKVEEFQPIACCNVSYNVISKILAARLSVLLPNLIDPAQATFVQGRSMVENIYLVQEFLNRYGWSRISPRCIMKIDLKKAYDTINWEFVRKVLMGFGLPNLFVNWIIQCISTTAYSISINGSMHGFFKGKQGIRQGDPISPFLFVLCLEYLSRSLNQLKDNRDFKFHPRCQDLNITHLAFADDLMLFSRGDVESVQLLMNKMRRFGDYSGLRVSMEKSNLYASGIPRDDLEAIKAISGFSEGRFPFRYLGLLVASTKLTIAQFHSFTDKIAGYLNAWAGMKLSYAGRCELIRFILQGMECFWLASLQSLLGLEKDSSRCAVGTKMEHWVFDGKFCSKAAYEFFRPRKGNLTWPKGGLEVPLPVVV
ncbi:hypothetical protein Acr_04g0003320 [Actinidia rufa]|uniref:Reverse transcriptase domain-containing protein n=1 Tax=Actinidia rufa TaxID=165716 RepID=A0A7J0EGI9_9ERIC|nr:hypothetical protein Acr_04g0003320 [Actinidia rufa]